LGRISRDISGDRRWRRQRLRSAIATAFLARFCPMTYLSSSATISRGVLAAAGGASASFSPGIMKTTGASELLDRDAVVRVDVHLRRDQERLRGDLRRGQLRLVLQEGARGREREGSSRADREHALLGRDQVAGPRDEERALLVGHDQQSLELAQHL